MGYMTHADYHPAQEKMQHFKVGDTVRLKPSLDRKTRTPEGRENNTTAKIKALLPEIEGGLYLDQDLRGCRYWNVLDVIHA